MRSCRSVWDNRYGSAADKNIGGAFLRPSTEFKDNAENERDEDTARNDAFGKDR